MRGELKNGKLYVWREKLHERLQKRLVEKYPKIFPPNFGFEHSNGWYWLVDKLCDTLQFQTDYNEMPQIRAAQVKEKFGVLKFYHEHMKGGTPALFIMKNLMEMLGVLEMQIFLKEQPE